MDTKSNVVFLLALATAYAGIIVPIPKILEGPSSKTTLIGPDGSKISAVLPGGKIVLDGHPGPVLQGAPEVVALAGIPQPLPVLSTQVVEEVSPVVTEVKSDDAVAVEAKEAETSTEAETKEEPTTVPAEKEPEDKSTTTTEAPASVAPLSKAPAPAAAKDVESPVVLSYIQNSPFFVPDYSEFDGQFVPDAYETPFDDGSYKHGFSEW